MRSSAHRSNYDFYVQASTPREMGRHDPEDESVIAAIETVFVSDTEYGVVIWNHCHVPFSYRWDFSCMVYNVLDALEALQATPEGSFKLGSDTFSADWQLYWRFGILRIHADWHNVLGGIESSLNARPTLELAVDDFIAEWRRR
jgi:hypothetical protein